MRVKLAGRMEPLVSGKVDLDYLSGALARAGTPWDAAELVTDALTDGRTAAAVTRLSARAADGHLRSWVLKVVPPVSWRQMLGVDGSEARLWLSGATRSLPARLRCPTVDVARQESRGEWWILMEDVSNGILPRGAFDETKAKALLRSVARLHARYWGRDGELGTLPLVGFDRSANAFARLSVQVARGETVAEPWLAHLNEDFWVPRVTIPHLLNALPPEDADFYIQLCADHSRIASALDEYPRTLCHGDLRRANIAFVDDDVVLFDWELAASGPAARDLMWYWFLQFWAYPPDDGRSPDDRGGLLDVYFETLERERGCEVDRAELVESCELAWLSVFCQLGFLLADALTDPAPTADAVARAKRAIAEGVGRARRIHDHHVR